MADKELSAITAAGTLDGTETVHVVQSGNSRRATLSDLETQAFEGTAKAWCYSDGLATTPAVDNGYNCSSITDDGTGDYEVNLTNIFSVDASTLGFQATTAGNITFAWVPPGGSSSSKLGVNVRDSSGTAVDGKFAISVLGPLA